MSDYNNVERLEKEIKDTEAAIGRLWVPEGSIVRRTKADMDHFDTERVSGHFADSNEYRKLQARKDELEKQRYSALHPEIEAQRKKNGKRPKKKGSKTIGIEKQQLLERKQVEKLILKWKNDIIRLAH